MRVGEILRIASDDHNAVPEVKKANVHALCVHLQGALRFQKRLKLKKLVPHKFLRFLNMKYSTHHVVFVYFLAKFAFLLNAMLQFKLLTRYLLPHDMEHHGFGFEIWRGFLNGNTTWMDSGLFPRVTLCDFDVREMANIQKHTVQCVLLINIFTEKIFLILWAWYTVLISFTACNLLSWVFLMFNRTAKEHFIFSRLEMSEDYDKYRELKDRKNVDQFLDKYLGLDGVFLLQLIAQHADVVFSSDLIASLWQSYYNIEEQRRALKQMNTILPLLRAGSAKRGSISEKCSPDVAHMPRHRNPRKSVGGPPNLPRTMSVDDAGINEGRTRDSSEEESQPNSKRGSKPSSRPGSRRPSKIL